MFPIIIENSKLLKIIKVNSITLGIFILCQNELSDIVLRKNMINYIQQKELFYFGYFAVFLFDYLYSALKLKKGFGKKSLYNIRFYKEAYYNCENSVYLLNRKKFSWKNYKL